MDIVIIHWRIRPGHENRRRFLSHWSGKFTIENRANLVGEFLSEPLTKEEVHFDCKTFEESVDYTSFFNVGIWKDAASFKTDVYDRLAKDRDLESYEFDYPDRMVLTGLNWRRGELQLPDTDHLQKEPAP
jgi:hypothetical protein